MTVKMIIKILAIFIERERERERERKIDLRSIVSHMTVKCDYQFVIFII